jgi:hypothetical protein
MSLWPFFTATKNFMLIALGIGFLSAGAGVGYYYGVYLPNIDNKRERIEGERIKFSREKYKKCVSEANEIFAVLDINKITSQDYTYIQKRTDYKIEQCLDEFKAGV